MTVSVLLSHHVRLELRGREALVGSLLVGILVVLVVSIGLEARVDPALVAPTVAWAALAFGAQVGLARSFLAEHQGGTLELQRLAGATGFRLLLAKSASNFLVTLLVAALVVPAIALLLDYPEALGLLGALPILLLGTAGLALVTSLVSAVAYRAKSWSLLVPLLALPILFPLLAAAISGTRDVAAGHLADAWPEASLLFLYDSAYLVAAWVLADPLLEE